MIFKLSEADSSEFGNLGGSRKRMELRNSGKADSTAPPMSEEEKAEVKESMNINEAEEDDAGSATDEDEPLMAGVPTGPLTTVEEEEEDDGHREPVHDGRTATFMTESVNPYLMCHICKGYLSNAHTAVECMHSYCFSCIMRHLVAESVAKPGWNPKYTCPKCKTSLGSEPMDLVKADPVLQNIVDKLFPDLMVREREANKEFCEKRGLPLPSFTEKLPNALIRRFIPEGAGKAAEVLYGEPFDQPDDTKQKKQRSVPVAAEKARKKRKVMAVTEDTIKIRLMCVHGEEGAPGDARIRPLPRPLLQTSQKITMRHLKKFLVRRLALDNEKEVEILFKNRVMGDEHTLAFITSTMGSSDDVPVLSYRAREVEYGM